MVAGAALSALWPGWTHKALWLMVVMGTEPLGKVQTWRKPRYVTILDDKESPWKEPGQRLEESTLPLPR